ncbi:hypothetical protein WKI68_05800 [Streptomyces sp. MS1.HAVA.3]|uniref:Uncharacterized protein n=1 Tax=Streptomyces caledonius TaxID=3134107 RepID=A0ABU8TZR5_9ACTN
MRPVQAKAHGMLWGTWKRGSAGQPGAEASSSRAARWSPYDRSSTVSTSPSSLFA